MKLLTILPFASTILAESDLLQHQKDWCVYLYKSCDLENPDSPCYAPEKAEQTSLNLCQPGCKEAIEEAGLDSQLFDQYCPNRNTNCPRGGCSSSFNLAGIDGYGCWCNLGSDLMKGSGPVQNVFDGICKKFNLCLRCARWDGVDQGYGCNPLTDNYNALGNPAFGTDCSAANQGDDCGVSLCSCNVNFFQRLLELLWSNTYYDDSYLHENGFDTSVCFSSDYQDNDVELSCCGKYPDRFPYNKLSDDKECCANTRLYNPMTHECCGGKGKVRLPGTC